MNPLGYINLFWLHEVLNSAVHVSDDWYRQTCPEKVDFEMDSYVLAPYTGNAHSLQPFLAHGLRPVFDSLNDFQKVLVLDCLALLLARDEPSLWEKVNFFDTVMSNRIVLAEEPEPLFRAYFDVLSAGTEPELATYRDISAPVFNPADHIQLYQFC
ncbi:hypothetical protein DEIGR_101408 [Deinococcus grandis]|uniref:Uncharacterized protein n=1 Tax=Deinococcus grandis TaxID=57498 RepID=A0A100HIH9_9DEIO|nr:hypothetical protein [Deinococcus grandis]BBN95124.1 hypothetical protein DEGR_18570 [Deinococcus grandis]GAQ21381.1 hypothetical protein DEIGR_101408 [Deinococcus grandis]